MDTHVVQSVRKQQVARDLPLPSCSLDQTHPDESAYGEEGSGVAPEQEQGAETEPGYGTTMQRGRQTTR